VLWEVSFLHLDLCSILDVGLTMLHQVEERLFKDIFEVNDFTLVLLE